MLNNCDIIDTIARDKWFDRTVNLHSRHQPEAYKGGEQTEEIDADVSVSSTKTSGWSGLKISFHGRKSVTKDGSDLIEMVIMDSGTKIKPFGNTNMITNRQKLEMPINFLTNAGSKIVDEVGEIPGAVQKHFIHG